MPSKSRCFFTRTLTGNLTGILMKPANNWRGDFSMRQIKRFINVPVNRTWAAAGNSATPLLQDLRSFQIERPFQKLLIFHRVNEDEEALQAWRLTRGAGNLPRRLIDPEEQIET